MIAIKRWNFLATITFLCGIALATPPCAADVYYVDNLRGSDAFDGRSTTTAGTTSGPTRTIRRALEYARHGDTVIIRNNGQPYYESLSLVGRKHSGFEGLTFTIVGNGAVIDGSDPIHPAAWRHVGANLWRFTPWRKGYYQMILKDTPVREHKLTTPPKTLPAIPAGRWFAWKGTIYYQAAEKEDPRTMPFRYAARSVGLTLYDVVGVLIADVTFRHFRLDGVNAHDRCGIVKFEQVTSVENGRAGFAIGGCSGRLRMADDNLPTILLRNCKTAGNRRHSLLFTNRGTAQVQDSKLAKPPTLEK